MKRNNSAAFAFFAAFAFWTGVANAQTGTPGDAQKGKELYLKYSCYACHSYDGHGGAAPRLVPPAMTVSRVTAHVHNPRRMPPYTEKVLADAQLADLFADIKSMPASPPAGQISLLEPVIEAKELQRSFKE